MNEPIELWHNPRCSKSRQALELLEAKNVPLSVRKYLEEPLSRKELARACAHIRPTHLLRTKEAAFSPWQETLDALSSEDVIDILMKHPAIMERPIVFRGGRALIARPPERIQELFD